MAFFILWAFLAHFFLYRRGFFRLPPTAVSPSTFPKTLMIGAIVFAVFIIAPLFSYGVMQLYKKGEPLALTAREKGIIHFISILCVMASLFIFSRVLMGKGAIRKIFWGENQPDAQKAVKDTILGMGMWLVAFPVVAIYNALVSFLLEYLKISAEKEQVAVLQLKSSLGDPLLFSFMVVGVIILVPLIEEWLFRGLLQASLRKKWETKPAILVTAAIFSALHFAPSQGMTNVELIPALFILACYLGFLYEKKQTLWAPYGLHLVFNGVTVLLVILGH